jgi:hypothetical protein
MINLLSSLPDMTRQSQASPRHIDPQFLHSKKMKYLGLCMNIVALIKSRAKVFETSIAILLSRSHC